MTSDAPPYRPFPVGSLPGAVGEYVAAASAAIGCDASYVAMPVLASLARAIGGSRVVRLKRSWTEPPIIWAAIVGPSGTHKSPAMHEALRPLHRRQGQALAEHAAATAQYMQDLACHERDLAAWRRAKTTDPPPEPPQEPACERYIACDCTIEALASLLAAGSDGILVARDELAGWLGGIAEYKGGRGSDLGHWLACWSAEPMIIDRKTGAVRMLHIPRAAVSLVGGIQPAVLRSAIGREHLQDGLCARLLLAMPSLTTIRWSEATVPEAVEAALEGVLDGLLSLEPATDDDGSPVPYPLGLTRTAKDIWVEYYDRHRAEMADLDDDLRAAWSKLEAYTARLALIHQLSAWAAGDADGDAVDAPAMTAAIELTEWFGCEARRVYGLFGESDDDREQRELVELIRRRGGSVTPRELRASARRYRRTGEAEAALEGLARAGLGRWEVVPTATKPRQQFTLVSASTVSDSHISPDSRESETVDSDTTAWSDPLDAVNGELLALGSDDPNDWGTV